MTHAHQYKSIDHAISQHTTKAFVSKTMSSVSGGCINQASRIEGKDGRIYFLKQNNLRFLPFFEAEARALIEIKETGTIQVPQVIVFGETAGNSFLVLQFLEQGSSSKTGQKQLGRELAQLHQVKKSFFGWDMDNCIGATPQPNPKSENWVDFYRNHRLVHQLELAKQKGKEFGQVESLLAIFSFATILRPLPFFMAISGEETLPMIPKAVPLFLILRVTTVTARPTWHLLTCSVGSPAIFTKHIMEFTLSIRGLQNARFFTTCITN